MSDYDKGWVIWLILGVAIGFFVGYIVVQLLSLFVTNTALLSIFNLIQPIGAICGLLVVSLIYQKEKEKTIQ